MPIKPIVLQRRHAELGRIRLGAKRDSGAPMRLDSFRFTSVSEQYIRDLATLYGGDPKAWDNGGIASWEVYTDARSIPVIAVKGGLSQWMETWSGGGCTHRCDGETNVLTGDLCNPDDPAHKAAKPTTRLGLMLPELEAIGVWRMETHGWNAAAEIPAVAELAQYVGELVPAVLHLVERRAVRDGKTSRFVVPVLDLQIGAAKLREVVAAKMDGAPVLAGPSGGGPAEIEAPRPDYAAVAATLLDVDSVRDLWRSADAAGHLDAGVKAALTARVEQIQQARVEEAAAPPAAAAESGDVVDGQLVEPDPNQVWKEILAEAGQRGMSTPDLEDSVAEYLSGITAAEASGAELELYLEDLRRRPVPGEAVPA